MIWKQILYIVLVVYSIAKMESSLHALSDRFFLKESKYIWNLWIFSTKIQSIQKNAKKFLSFIKISSNIFTYAALHLSNRIGSRHSRCGVNQFDYLRMWINPVIVRRHWIVIIDLRYTFCSLLVGRRRIHTLIHSLMLSNFYSK